MRIPAIVAGWTFLICTLAALTWFAFFGHLNADQLYSQALLGDLWEGTAPFRWMLQPANGLFPGLLVAAFGFALGLDNVPYYIFFAAAFSVLFLLATALVLQRAALEPAQAWAAAVLSLILMYLINPYNWSMGHLLFYPGSHFGVVPMALLCFALTARVVETTRPNALSLFVSVSLTMLSDMLTLLQIVLPILAAMILIVWQQPQLRRIATMIILTTSAAAGIGAGIYIVAGWSGIVDHGPMIVAPLSTFQAAKIFVTTLPQLFSVMGTLHMICVVLGLGVGLYVTLRATLSNCSTEQLPILLMTFSSLGGLVGPIAVGTYVGPVLFRQQLSLYTMPIIILVWSLCKGFHIPTRTLAPATIALCLLLIGQSATRAWYTPFVINPPFVRVAERLAELPADLTFAFYWEAKPIYIASGRQLMVCPIGGGSAVLNWVSNYGWCAEGLRRWATRRHWLAVNSALTDDMDAVGSLIARFGVPDREVEFESRRILLYAWNPEREAHVRSIVCGGVGRFRRAPPC